MVQEVLALEIALTNRLTISCFPSTLRSLRGWSIPVGALDELAFFRMEGAADSDAEIQASIRRGMLSFPNPRLIKISTPYMKSGVLFEDFKIAFGQDDPDRLVWRASSTLMNPSLKEGRLDRERRLERIKDRKFKFHNASERDHLEILSLLGLMIPGSVKVTIAEAKSARQAWFEATACGGVGYEDRRLALDAGGGWPPGVSEVRS